MSSFLGVFVELAKRNLMVSDINSDVWCYLRQRKVDFELARKYSIGYIRRKNVDFLNDNSDDFKSFQHWFQGVSNSSILVFPVFSAYGTLLGFICRSIRNKFYSKYFLPKYADTKTAKIIGLKENLESAFNYGYAFIVEGPFDMFAVSACGFPVFSVNTAFVSNSQARVLSRYISNVLILFDNDETGSNSNFKTLDKYGIIYYKVNTPLKYKDISEMLEKSSIEEVHKLLEKLSLPVRL